MGELKQTQGAAVFFPFRIKQRVRVIGAGEHGIVTGLMVEGNNDLSVRVAYWHGSSRTTVWLTIEEIESI